MIVDENSTVSADPYLSQTLVARGAYLPSYYGIGHNSADNYIAMVSGQAPNPLTKADCVDFVNFPVGPLSPAGQEPGDGCVYPANVPTLMSQLDAAGLSWRAYEDGMVADPARNLTATCAHPPVGAHDPTQAATATDQYLVHHDPFVYFHYVIDNPAECAANVVGLSQLPADLQNPGTTPNYVFITPSACNDGHDAPCPDGQPGGIVQADNFLRTWVPRITASPAFAQNGLLIITFDEAPGDSSACCNQMPGAGGGLVGAVLLSPAITPGTISTAGYNHYSLLASVEDLFGLPRIGAVASANAFGPDVYTHPSGIAVPNSAGGTPSGGRPALGAPKGKSGVGGSAGALSAAQLRRLIRRQIAPSRPRAMIAYLIKHRSCWVRFRMPEAGRALLQWYKVPAGATAKKRRRRATPVLIASGQTVFRFKRSRMIKLELTAAGRRLLKRGDRVKLTTKGTFRPRRGRSVSTSRTFVLRV